MQPSRGTLLNMGKPRGGCPGGGHRVAQHMGHDPGEKQRTPFFRLLFEGRKTYQNSVFRFLLFSLYLVLLHVILWHSVYVSIGFDQR